MTLYIPRDQPGDGILMAGWSYFDNRIIMEQPNPSKQLRIGMTEKGLQEGSLSHPLSGKKSYSIMETAAKLKQGQAEPCTLA